MSFLSSTADEEPQRTDHPQTLEVTFDGPASGPHNMARDEALLQAASVAGAAMLRFYTWSQPTLSLGYFQPYACRYDHPASTGCAVVRRPSGGGAIVHDRELTYCLALPPWHPLSTQSILLYQSVHRALVDSLGIWKVQAKLRGDHRGPAPRDHPVLCFLRQAADDVVVNGRKIAGSAQRRRRGAVLQHGSLLLGCSPAAPELPGVYELTGRRVDRNDLARCWADRLRQSLGLTAARSPSLRQATGSTDLLIRKYTSARWTRRR